MGDDSPHMNSPKYNFFFFLLSPFFLKPSCLLMHIMMVPPGTKPEFPFICKNCKRGTLGLAQTTVCTPHGSMEEGKARGKLSWSYGYICVEHQTSAEGVVLTLWKVMAVSQQDAFKEREGENKGLNMTEKGLRQTGKTGICSKPVPEYSFSREPLSACTLVSTASSKPCLKLSSKSLPNVHVKQQLRKLLLDFTKPFCF